LPCEASLADVDVGGADQSDGSGSGADGESQFQLTSLTAQPCTNNQCDKACAVYPEESGITCEESPTAGGGSVSNLPSGFQNKGLKDAAHPPSTAGCSSPADCQFDHYCDPNACIGSHCGVCKPWATGAYDTSSTKPDYTLKVACDGKIQVCNRGGATAPSGSTITVLSGNSSQLQDDLGKCSDLSGSIVGTCTVPSTIPPGGCIEVNNCSTQLTGTKAAVVNSPAAPGTVHEELSCANNWSVAHPFSNECQAGYDVRVQRYTYSASCAGSQQPRWTLLAYNSTLLSNSSGTSSLTVNVEASSNLTDLDPLCTGCTKIAYAPTTDPAICSMGGPSPTCPKQLAVALGTAYSAAHLQLEFRLTPTPDGKLPASLNSWEVSYTCVDDQ
jgi:hypothetical protein